MRLKTVCPMCGGHRRVGSINGMVDCERCKGSGVMPVGEKRLADTGLKIDPLTKPVAENEFPQDGTPFDVITIHTFRWMPYTGVTGARSSEAHKLNGVEGRWQRLEGNIWVNSPPPVGLWQPIK